MTHHDKKIVRYRKRFGGGSRMGLADSPELGAARTRYHVLLLASGRRPRRPLQGPIRLDITFVFASAAAAAGNAPKALEWHTGKPDRDNLEKTAVDCLVRAGFLAKDQEVCAGEVIKLQGPKAFVRIIGREMGSFGEEAELAPGLAPID